MIGRAIAILVMLASAGVIAWHHRDALMPQATAPEDPADAAYRACLEERLGHIDGMVADEVIDARQAETFRQRADALCRDLAGRQ